MLREKMAQFWNWVIEVEVTKTSVLHAALYVWLALGVVGVELLHHLDAVRGAESVDRLLGGGFRWWAWIILVVCSLIMFAGSQLAIFRPGPYKKLRYGGYFLVAGADIAALLAVAAYFVALYAVADLSASANWFRMCMAGFIITALAIFVARDIHRLVVIEVVRVRRDG